MDPITVISNDSQISAISGINTQGGVAIFGDGGSNGQGISGKSQNGYGITGYCTNSVGVKGVCGETIRLDPNIAPGHLENDPVAGVFGKHLNDGVGVFGKSENGEGIHGETNSASLAAVAGIQLRADGIGAGMYGENRGNGAGVVGVSHHSGAGLFGMSQFGEGVHGETNSRTLAAVSGIQLRVEGTGAGLYGENRGNGSAITGIQQNPESAAAAIYGESKGSGPAAFFRGNVLVTGDISLINGDVAEDFTVTNYNDVAAGFVMVLKEDGTIEPCKTEYDKKVAGVISGAGNYKPGLILDKQNNEKERMPIALMGKVFCYVDADLGAIEIGDMLTSSSTKGYAMKAMDPLKAFGAVIGKALRPLSNGKGLIPVLVSLQ